MSEYDWVKWVLAFAELAVEENTDMKLRMSLMKKAAKKRLEYLAKADTKFAAGNTANP